METVAGVFKSRSAAERAIDGFRSAGFATDKTAFLTPGTSDAAVEAAVPTAESEQPGMGAAMGGTVGGAMGIAGGATLGAAAASLLIPGVGPVIAGGIIGAALLGVGGAATGAATGAAVERRLDDGLPLDELYIYEDALRKGRSVAIVFADDSESAESARNVLAQAGAESIDAAREEWWLGLRDVEEETYQAQGRNFHADETAYRRGFELALNPKRRGKSYEAVSAEISEAASTTGSEDAFRNGYERGQAYQRTFGEKHPS